MSSNNDLDLGHSNSHGKFTAKIARSLKYEGFDVYYDHDVSSENVGKIVSATSEGFGRGDELSQLDIAVVEKESKNVAILLEIEETNDRPKNLLGDIFGVLLGNHVSFKGKKLNVGSFTTLILAGVSKTDHGTRNDYIREELQKINISTANAEIGNILIKSYKNENELIAQLPSLLDKIVRGEP
jgi:hypothetical protein